jgi:hypothetical protein
MTAKEMFEELGRIQTTTEYDNYKSDIDYLDKDTELTNIFFDLEDKKIGFINVYKITIEELKAINKQIEELGW